MRTTVSQVLAGDVTGQDVEMKGWVHRHRSSGGLAFLVLRDATGVVQVTVKKGRVPDEAFEAMQNVPLESPITVSGSVHEDGRAPGGYEVRASDVSLVHESEPFPITEHQSTELLLDLRHLWNRSREQWAVQRIRHHIQRAVWDHFDEEEFIHVDPPMLTTSSAEGGATVFELEYFGEPAYLTQSSQMYLEALVHTHEKVWCLAPSFRAEKSRTPRHLTEYWHLEAEMAWMGHDENLGVQERLVKAILGRVLEECQEELALLERDTTTLEAARDKPFEVLHYDDAVKLLEGGEHPMEWGEDFGTHQERFLGDHFGVPVFVTHFPAEIKAFYMALDEDGVHARCADLIVPEGYGELIGGSERSPDIDLLTKRLEAEGEDVDQYKWYLDLRRYGAVTTSGFGLGLERLVSWVCGLEHIRDAIPFPRTPTRAYP